MEHQPQYDSNAQDATYVQVQDVQPPNDEDSAYLNDIKTREWATGVFNCLDFMVPNCLMAWCCPCVTLAQVSYRLNIASYSTALLFFCILAVGNRTTGSVPQFSMSGMLANSRTLLGLIFWLVQTYAIVRIRQHIRRRFLIPGDALGDWLLSCCCGCCVAAQMATHVRSYRPSNCSFEAPDQLPAYQVGDEYTPTV